MLNETKITEEFIKQMDEHRKPLDPKEGLLEASSKSVIVFAERMLGIKLYSWQVDFATRVMKAINNDYYTKEFLALTSRQIGKSTIVAVISLWACIFNKYPGTIHNNTNVGIASATDVQSKKLLNEMKKLLQAGNTKMSEYNNGSFGKKFFTDLIDDGQPNNTTTITFKSYSPNLGLLLKDSRFGSSIKSYPPTNSILGETFTIVIEDEAGMSENLTDEFHYDYMYPTGNSTNAIRIYTSTPWVTSGFFYRLADPNDEFSDHPADRVLYTYEAVKLENPKYFATLLKTIDQWNRDGRTDEVRRAYMCQFVKGARSYFAPDTVNDMFTESYSMAESFGKECDMGIDFGGQVKSHTVITITALEDDGLHFKRIYHQVYPVGKDLALLQDIADLRTRFNIQRTIVDDCPAGDFLTRIMIEQKGWDITPMNFRSEKVKKYGAFRASLSRREIQSYIDNDLKTEMLALEFSKTAKQSLIEHAPGYTDDLIDSFIMSCYYFVQEEGVFKYHDLDKEEDNDTVYD